MDLTDLLDSLLSIGRSGRFADAQQLPGAGVHSTVLHLAGTHLNALLNYYAELNQSDRSLFIKAVAVYEDTVGGLGSVTTLHRLLPLTEDPDRAVLDWILSNTRSYQYYAYDAKSVTELDAWNRVQDARRAKSEQRERARQLAARKLKAERATSNLYNAVRRGDLSAVQALLAKGADPTFKAPDGSSLHEYAFAAGKVEIAAVLATGCDEENAS